MFKTFRTNGTIQYIFICSRVLLLSITFLRFVCVIASISISLIFIAKYSFVWIYHISFILLLFEGHLGCFCFLAVIRSAAANIHVQVFVWTYVFISLG